MNVPKKVLSACTLAMLVTVGLFAADGDGSGGGGAGGAGGGGQAIAAPVVSEEKLAAFEKSLSAEQRSLVDERIKLHQESGLRQLKEREANGSTKELDAIRASLADSVTIKKEFMSSYATMTPDELARYFKGIPQEITGLRREADPWYTTPEEENAAQKVSADVHKAADELLSEDIEVFILAQRKILSFGPECRALIAAAGRKCSNDPATARRIKSVISSIDAMNYRERSIRMVSAVLKRVAELEKARPKNAPGKLACMISRSFGLDSSDANGEMVYFSMPKGVNGYNGAVSLLFDNGDGNFDVQMYGGQQNTIKDLGAVDYTELKSAPNADETEQWGESAAPEVGHVYIEHCLEKRDNIDATFKFRVVDLHPREWAVIEYEKIAQKQ